MESKKRMVLVDPFYDVSHRSWAEGLRDHSRHEITVISQKPFYWRWRMVSSGIHAAKLINEHKEPFDLILATDMLHVSQMKSMLSSRHCDTPIALYMHENQITYDQHLDSEQTDPIYGWINYTSCLVADHLFFNSDYHRQSFLGALPDFLRQFPPSGLVVSVDDIASRSEVLLIGMTLDPPADQKNYDRPIFLWNHRWEHDKNPREFFDILTRLQDDGVDFGLIVCGKSYERRPAVFDEVEERFSDELIHFGYAVSRQEYLVLLAEANFLLVTSQQDFFGISVVEAIHHGCCPLLPNRLAYPEHIPEGLESRHLYDDGQLYQKLLGSIENLHNYDPTPLHQHVSRYSWTKSIDHYDTILAACSDGDS